MNILLAGTGSVAAIKYWKLFKALTEIGNVKGVLTEKGKFFAEKGIKEISVNRDDIYTDGEYYKDWEIGEWEWEKIGDPIPHIDLKDWAEILVIAPLTANTLTKMAVGICDNLLTSMYYAWPKNKPIIVAPAMNTDMWNNPLTGKHLKTLNSKHCSCERISPEAFYTFKETICQKTENDIFFGYQLKTKTFFVIEPVEAKLACGVTGKGAMAPIKNIVNIVKRFENEMD